jgi:carbonic anhydrase
MSNINISQKNVSGKCDLKCSYNFNYSESNTTAKNNGVTIALTYDNSSVPPVIYNNQKYTVSNITIMCPSIHMFNGSAAAAEIVIEHVPISGGPNLMVAIPFTSSSESSAASNVIMEIIKGVSTNAPSEGNSTNLNITGFNLQTIIPLKPFFSYTSPDNNDWIVFGSLEAIPLNSNILATLGKIIKPYPISTRGAALFYNSSGPNTGKTVGDGIYISCQPTGSSEEKTAITYSKNQTSYDFSNVFNNPTAFLIFQVLIGCILFIIIFLFCSYIFSWITTGSVKFPSINMNNSS